MEDEFKLFETDFWKIVLADNQSYLGRCVILLKRDCEALSGLTDEEWSDLHENIIKRIEPALKKAFDATMFNWAFLMNRAYREKDTKPYVHLHLFPRYSQIIMVGCKKFEDKEFGYHYDDKIKDIVSKDLLKKIYDQLMSCI